MTLIKGSEGDAGMPLKDEHFRLSRGGYGQLIALRPVYADMDGFRHVNNGAIGRYFEEGRADMNMRIFGEASLVDPPGGLQLLFASVTTDFLAQVRYPGMVEVGTAVERIGRSSWQLAQALFQDGRCAALASATMVKAIDGVSALLSDAEREALQARMIGRD